VFCEAGVSDNGDVDVGQERLIPLKDIGAVHDKPGGEIGCSVMGHNGKLLAEIHFEQPEPHQVWMKALKALITTNGNDQAGATAQNDGGDEENEVYMLQARSRQLQNRIGNLEAMNERRDKQLNKMERRLDGATEMLSAVQEMCNQQEKVISAQKVAITELQNDLGLEAVDADRDGKTGDRSRPDADSEDSPDGAGQDTDDAADDDVNAQTEKMMALLAQAEQMQKMLQLLEGRGADLASESSGSPQSRGGQAATLSRVNNAVASPQGQGARHNQDLDDDGDLDGVDSEEAALQRLRNLESEKLRFEGLLRDSQQEHQDLLDKLTSMRSLMSALGLEAEDDADEPNDDN